MRSDRHPARARPLPPRHRHGGRQSRSRLAAPAPARRRLGGAARRHRRLASASGCGVRALATSSLRHARRRVRSTLPVPHGARDHRRVRARASPCASRTSASSDGSCTPRPSTAGPCGARSGRRAGRTAWSPAGYRAIDALRLEKGYRVWSTRHHPRRDAVRRRASGSRSRSTRAPFIGRDALVAAKAAGPRKRLRCLVLDDPRSVCLGNEPVRVGGDDRRPGDLGRLRLRGRAFHRVRLPAAGSGRDRDARRGRGLRRVDRLRGRPRAPVRPRRREDPRVTDARRRSSGRTGQHRSGGGSDAELRGWLDVALAACDEADAIARGHFRRDLVIETKPDRTFVTQADTAIERTIRERLARRLPRSRARRRGVRNRSRRRVGPLVHRPDRRHPQLHARRPVVRDPARASSATASSPAAVLSAPALGERWWARRGGGAWASTTAARRATVSVSRVARWRRPDPVRLRARHRGVGAGARVRPPPPRCLARTGLRRLLGLCAGRRGRRRGDGRGRPVALGRRPRRSLLVEEAGGRATDLRGARSIHAGTPSRPTASSTPRSSRN